MSVKTFIETLTYLMPLLLTTGVLLGFMRFSRLDGLHRMFVGYLVMALTIDLSSRTFGLLMNNNLFFISLFGLLELVFFIVLYARYFLRNQPRVLFLVPIVALGVIAWELFSAKWKDPARFNAYSRVADPIAVVFMCMLHFREIGKDIVNSKAYWRLNSAILLFFSLNMFFFLPMNFLINVPMQVKFYFWLANLLLTLIFYTFLIRELWKNGKTRQPLQHGS